MTVTCKKSRRCGSWEVGGMVQSRQDSLVATLLVAPRRAVVEQVMRALGQLTDLVESSTDLTEAGSLGRSRHFDAVVIAFESPPDELSWLTSRLRRADSASRTAAVVVCCGACATLRGGHAPWPGVNRVVLWGEIEDTLCSAVQGLLNVAPRVKATLPSRIEVAGTGFSRRFFCQTVNVSSSGMLLRVPHSLRPGTQLRFELFVSGTMPPVRGYARVVRLARPDREPFPAVGIAFSHLDVDDQARLIAHLQRSAA